MTTQIKTVAITGAGTGVGRAAAVRMARDAGWNVVLIGRTLETLKETQRLCGSDERSLICVCDVADPDQVLEAIASSKKKFESPHALVNSAGFNVPDRSLEKLSLENYHKVINANLNGAYYCVQAVLPEMRRRGEGTIVNVISDAGKIANTKAGVSYVASKFGLSGLTQAINAEERQRGIRACGVFPGEINTPLLDKRPSPPPQSARELMLQAEDVAECIALAILLPGRALVEEILVRPTKSAG